MKKNITKELFINDYSKSIINGSASLFIGSGLSRKANYVGWKDILKDCALEIGLDVDKEKDLITLAQYYVREKQKTKITETIKEFFADDKGSVQEVHRIIASLPINNIWTTNYDSLIERAFEEAGICTTILTDDNSYRDIDRNAKVKIYKIHGTVKSASNCIISRQDYDIFPTTHDIVMSELKGEMCSNSFLFLGYSFSDTDIQHILTKIRLEYDARHPQRHYCIIEKIKRKNKESDDDFVYRNTLQEHHISDMQSYGINVLLVDSYDEIENLLKEIRNKVYKNNVMVSGSYEDDNNDVCLISKISNKLASSLIMEDYVIYCGYGKNLGVDIVEGAYDGYTKKSRKKYNEFDKKIKIVPFPYKKKNSERKMQLYDEIRNYLISVTKTLIIISNKNNSPGVYEEYKKALNNNNLIIPIPSFGGITRKIWNELNKNILYNKCYEFQQLANEKKPDEVCELVLKIIKNLGEKL